MDKNKKITIEMSLEEAKHLYHTRSASFYMEQEDRFILMDESEQPILDELNELSKEDKNNVSFYYSDTYLEALLHQKLLKANGHRAILVSDEAGYADYSWLLMADVPTGFGDK